VPLEGAKLELRGAATIAFAKVDHPFSYLRQDLARNPPLERAFLGYATIGQSQRAYPVGLR